LDSIVQTHNSKKISEDSMGSLNPLTLLAINTGPELPVQPVMYCRLFRKTCTSGIRKLLNSTYMYHESCRDCSTSHSYMIVVVVVVDLYSASRSASNANKWLI